MKPRWEALATRAHGLRTHLLAEDRLLRIGRATSVAELALGLRGTPYEGFLPPPREAAPRTVEVAVSRSLAARMATLARWAAPDGEALRVIFLEQDVRNVRAILRGAAGGLGPEERLAGCIPTPTLARKALELLARAESPGAVAATLATWDHALGSAVLEEASKGRPDLFRLETALIRAFAERAPKAAKRAGKHVRSFVAESLDGRNVVTALLLAGSRSESPPEELFVEGGALLPLEAFREAAQADDRPSASARLAEGTRGTLFEAALVEGSASPTRVATRILAGRIHRLTEAGRTEPVSALPVLLFVLRLREEGRRVRHALWAAALAGGATA